MTATLTPPRTGDPFTDEVDNTADGDTDAVDPSAAAAPAVSPEGRELADARA